MSENNPGGDRRGLTPTQTNGPRDIRLILRLAGLLPLAFFAVHSYRNWSAGNPGYMLWMCHVSNLVLGVGLLAGRPFLIRLAIIWQLPAIPLWIMDMCQTGEAPLITFFSHLGGPAVGLVALRAVGANRWTWLYAIAWYLLIQQLSRMFTRPELNVNVAHAIYPGWERVYSHYWQYWLFTTIGAAVMVWITGRVLLLIAPPNQGADGQARQAGAGD